MEEKESTTEKGGVEERERERGKKRKQVNGVMQLPLVAD